MTRRSGKGWDEREEHSLNTTSQGFCPDRLARIAHFLQDEYVGPGRLPCAHFLLARRGEVVSEAVLGWQDVERGVPLTADTVHRIYSMTKPVTSVALMTLVEEGRIALDDRVDRYIPEWRDLTVASGTGRPAEAGTPTRPMLVSDLLTHTSGLTYGFQNRTDVDAAYRRLRIEDPHAGHDLQAMIGMLAGVPLEFSPGEAWNYSVSTDVVGYLVEKVSGQRLDRFLHERIFGPLRMVDTGFSVREDQRPRFAACYEAVGDGGFRLQDDPTTSPFLRPPKLLSGGGGLVGTAADYLRFATMLARGGELGGARILAPKTLRLMTANHLPGGQDLTQLSRSMFSESTYAGVGFGLGFAVVFDPPRTQIPGSQGEFYWGGMASTAFWVDPVEEIAAVFMSQLIPSSTWPIRRQLRTLTYAALIETNG